MEKSNYKRIIIRPRKGAPGYLLRSIQIGLAAGFHVFKIGLIEDEGGLYPNIAAPIAGIIQYYQEYEGCTFLQSKTVRQGTYAWQIGLLKPYFESSTVKRSQFLNKVWYFDDANSYDVVTGIVESLRQAAPMGKGMIKGLELCLNEIADNVLLHSRLRDAKVAPCGFIMAQVHKNQGRVAIAVYDNGIGIPESLRSAGILFDESKDALALATKRGVTDGNGVGNGLWILDSMVKDNQGSFEITSGGARYTLRHLQRGEAQYPAASFSDAKMLIGGSTLVDFRIDCTKDILLGNILPQGESVDYWKENHENPCNEEDCLLDVMTESVGLGTRYDASRFANIALNAAREFRGHVILDFDNVDIISMSFADELLSALIKECGMVDFMRIFKISNLNDECRLVMNAVISGRFGI